MTSNSSTEEQLHLSKTDVSRIAQATPSQFNIQKKEGKMEVGGVWQKN